MDATNPLLQVHRVPGQVKVEQNPGVLKVDAFPARCRANHHPRAVRLLESLFGGELTAVVAALENDYSLAGYAFWISSQASRRCRDTWQRSRPVPWGLVARASRGPKSTSRPWSQSAGGSFSNSSRIRCRSSGRASSTEMTAASSEYVVTTSEEYSLDARANSSSVIDLTYGVSCRPRHVRPQDAPSRSSPSQIRAGSVP